MLTGFKQPASAHTRDIGIWQWSEFGAVTAHLSTAAGVDYTEESIVCENVVPAQHAVFRANGIGFRGGSSQKD